MKVTDLNRPIYRTIIQEKTEGEQFSPYKVDTDTGANHLEDTASQSWPSPRGRWPVRPTTEGRELLLPGDRFGEW